MHTGFDDRHIERRRSAWLSRNGLVQYKILPGTISQNPGFLEMDAPFQSIARTARRERVVVATLDNSSTSHSTAHPLSRSSQPSLHVSTSFSPEAINDVPSASIKGCGLINDCNGAPNLLQLVQKAAAKPIRRLTRVPRLMSWHSAAGRPPCLKIGKRQLFPKHDFFLTVEIRKGSFC